MIATLERYVGDVGDEWRNSLVIGEGLSVVGGLGLFVNVLK